VLAGLLALLLAGLIWRGVPAQDEQAPSPPSSWEHHPPAAPPRHSHVTRRQVVLEPLAWRRNRKKITELTEITSLKSESTAATPASTAEPMDTAVPESGMDRVGPSKADKSLTTRWLAEHWGGIPTTAAAPAAAAAAAGRQWPTLQPRQATARDGDPGLEQAAQPGAATWDGTGGGRARRAARRLEKGTLCEALARQYGVVPHATWGTLPDDQHGTWASLRCDERLQGDAADSVASNRKDTGASHGEARQECSWLRLEHAVQVGQSWGTLSTEQRARWTQLRCDEHVRASASSSSFASQSSGSDASPQQDLPAEGGPQRRGRIGAVQDAPPTCVEMQVAHRVRVGLDWGSLPPSLQRRWTILGCDTVVN